MRPASLLGIAALTLAAAACQDATSPEPAKVAQPAFAVEDQCYGRIVAGISSTWPWAHEDHVAFQPPPGAIALWLQTFGPGLGIDSVRELQLLFCS